jgi:hypothetical protein
MTRSLLYYRGYIGESGKKERINLQEQKMSLEDRPPSHEKRFAITVDLLKLWRKMIGEPYGTNGSEHPCSDYCTTRLSEIDARIDAAIAGANGARDREREETGGA